MKKTKQLLFVFVTISYINCKSQTTILEKYNKKQYGLIENAYYKDTQDYHNQFVGTWLYQNGTTSLKIIFEKRDQILKNSNPKYYSDYLVGEYEYIENNILKINTLPNISMNNETSFNEIEQNHHLISISQIKFPQTFPQCNECLPNEKRLEMTLSEPNYNGDNDRRNIFVVRSFIEGGVNKLKVWFINLTQTATVDSNGNTFTPPPYILPTGEYILTKQ